MKKILFWIFSAMLVVSGTITASAQAPARKVSNATSAFATIATPAPAHQTQRVTFATKRAANQAVGFRTAATTAAAPHRTIARAEGTAIPDINGVVVFANSWQQAGEAHTNYSQLPTAAGGAFSEIFAMPAANGASVYSAIMEDGILYSSELVDVMGWLQLFYFSSYDGETGEQLTNYNSETPDVIFMGMAKDPASGLIYAIGYNADASGFQLVTLGLGNEAPAINVISTFDYAVLCISFDAEGQMYAMLPQETDTYLAKIDKATGAVEVVGATGIISKYISGGCIDAATNKFYYHASTDNGGSLYSVDLTTAAAALVCDFADGEEVAGLQLAPVVAPGTPGKPENLTATFSEGSLSGTVAFDAPALEDVTTLDYTVYVDGAEAANGTVAPGAHAEVAVTVAAAGMHTISVKLANGTLTGKAAKVELFIGNGVPVAPTVTAAWADGMMTVSWTAVVTTADGGYIDPAAVRYDVVRLPDNVTVATDLAVTSFTEEIPAPTEQVRYSYEVTAKFDGKSATGTSNAVALGVLYAPYSNDFATEERFNEMNVIDVNNDGRTWAFDGAGLAKYTYSTTNDADDWLITPVLTVEPGKVYPLSFRVRANSIRYPETIEVFSGDASSVEAMTTTVLEPTVIADNEYQTLEYLLVAPASGKLAVGFHVISPADQYNLYLDDVVIGDGMSGLTPAAPTDIVVTPDALGTYKTTVSCKAPALSINGTALTGNVDMVIMRGETLVYDGSVAAGAEINVTDEITDMTESGNVTYMFMAANADGAGPVASATVFVGVDYPAAPEAASFTEPSHGTVTVTWTPVTTTSNGAPLDASLITYSVFDYDGSQRTLIADNLTGTSHTFDAGLPEGEQDFKQYLVFAVTSRGEGEGAITDMAPVGTPYPGMAESFPNGTLSHPFAMRRLNGSTIQWGLFDDESGISSQDGDNGFIGSQGQYLEESSALIFPKVSLAGMVNPAFTFYTYNLVGEGGEADENLIEVEVREFGTEEYTPLFSKSVAEIGGSAEGWAKATVSLVGYENKVVELRVITTIMGFTTTVLDNLKIGSQLGNDLKLQSIVAPATVAAGADYAVQVKVSNEGALDAAAYTVELYADGELLSSKQGANLASGSSKAHNFMLSMHPLAEEAIAYHAVVVYEGDENPVDNTVDPVTVTPKLSNLPRVADLAGSEVAEGVKLTWSEPNLESVPEVKTEGFEEATAFAHEFEGWTFVDIDGGMVGGFQNTEVPGITPGQTSSSFFVFEQSDAYPQFNLTFAAHSGNKYLACLFNYDDSQIDDWAISPELTGNAQTISFYARSYSGDYKETISILYSTGSTNTEDFIAVEGKANMVVPDGGSERAYTLYEAQLPEGAKYFAIRSHAAGSFMLLLDDVTFEAAGATASLSIVGYDVYRNGEKITAEPVGETEFIDANPLENAEYRVTVNYNKGVSAGSNAVTVQYSGVEGIGAAGITISTAHQAIVVKGAEGQQIIVNAVDGRTVFAGQGAATTRVAVASGVYLVKAGDKVAKVIVR